MSNPVLNEKRWDAVAETFTSDSVMTVGGTIAKTFFLLILLIAAGIGTWYKFWNHGEILPAAQIFFYIGAFGGLILGTITQFFPKIAAFTAPLYAICEGIFLGTVTMIFNKQFPGLPLEAGCLTIATLLGMLFLYQANIIRATPMFVRGVTIGVFGLVVGSTVLYLLNSFFGVGGGVIASINGNGAIGIAFSVFCVGLAALSLVVNFDIIERGARDRAPRGMEWYAAFGLMVTLVWLYVEILVLLAKLQGQRREQ